MTFTKDRVPDLPQNRLKFETVEDHKLEILVNRGGEDEFLWESVCQSLMGVLEIIFDGIPDLDVLDDNYTAYSYTSFNRMMVIVISLDRTPTPPVITLRSDDGNGGHMMMDILYRSENFGMLIRELLPFIDPSNSVIIDSNEEDITEDQELVFRETVGSGDLSSSNSETDEIPEQSMQNELSNQVTEPEFHYIEDSQYKTTDENSNNDEPKLSIDVTDDVGFECDDTQEYSLVEETNDNGSDNESAEQFDSFSSDILNRILPNGHINESPPSDSELENFDPMGDAWYDDENKINKKKIDLTMPADFSSVTNKRSPVLKNVKFVIYGIPENTQRLQLKSFFNNCCLGSQPEVVIDRVNIDEKTHKAYVEVIGSGGADEFTRCVNKRQFCSHTLRVNIQYERVDPETQKLHSLIHHSEMERHREQQYSRSGPIRTCAQVTMHTTTSSVRDSCLRAAEIRTTDSSRNNSGASNAVKPGLLIDSNNKNLSEQDLSSDSKDPIVENKTEPLKSHSEDTKKAAAEKVPDSSKTTTITEIHEAVQSPVPDTKTNWTVSNNTGPATNLSDICVSDICVKPPKTHSTVPNEEVPDNTPSPLDHNQSDVATASHNDVISGVSTSATTLDTSTSTSSPSAPNTEASEAQEHATSSSCNTTPPPTHSDTVSLADTFASLVIDFSEEEEVEVKERSICQREVRLEPPPSSNRDWNNTPATPLNERLLTSHIATPCAVSRVVVTWCESDGVWVVGRSEYQRLRKYNDMLRISHVPLENVTLDEMIAVKINQVFCRARVLEAEGTEMVEVRLLDLGEVRCVPRNSLYGIKSAVLRKRESLAKKRTLYQCRVKDSELFISLVKSVLCNKEVDMLVYEDDRVDFLICSGLCESSFIKICGMSGAARYTIIREYPVSLNNSCSYKVVSKLGRTLSVMEVPEVYTDVQDVCSTRWHAKLQAEQFAEYIGGQYCIVKCNEAWHRGEVLNTDLFKDEHTVFLVDLGTTLTTSSVKELPAIYYDIPAQVIRCQVKGEWPENLKEGTTIKGYIFNEDAELIFNQDI